MIFNGRLESGAEDWACPDCGRRVLLRWPPDYQKLVLAEGDLSAVHTGGKGGFRLSGVAVTPEPAAPIRESERSWLHDNGIDWDARSA